MSERKNFCPIHHLYYTGNNCPLCEKERIDSMVKKYDSKEKQKLVKEEKQSREINEADIQRLIEKFNVK